ncbi:HTTM domain-containing protein [Pararhodonellum marinum]|uniref:HTTM domain-containing protein n=1 Tax=Pararhodonellum marinum TaxID=2755358 RepID=UPI00188FDE5A|nr:HTTM domain-containing protein [Pararhodonellum marinum]
MANSDALKASLFKPVDNTFLVVFRVAFGFLITAEAWGAIMTGWVRRAFVEPVMTFPFLDFPWLQPLPGNGMYVYFIIMGGFGILVMLGYYYRIGIVGYTILWSMVYFMQKTHYNNHYYLLILLCLFMCLVPAHRAFSLDVKRKPEIRSQFCPNWCRWIFIIQMGIVYTYAGIAKINTDWLQGISTKVLLSTKQHYWLVGEWLQQPIMHFFVAIGGLLFDLFITPLLLWNKTRKWAFMVSIFFHLFNSFIFQVGIFPYMSIGLCIFFFPPDQVRETFFPKRIPIPHPPNYRYQPYLIYGMMLWFLVQVMLPSRHWLFDSNVHWTNEGHRLSWRMMLRMQYGHVSFQVVDGESGETELVNLSDYLTPKQMNAVATHPDMCWQFVQRLKEEYSAKGKARVAIYAKGMVSLNQRPYQALYDPTADLAQVDWYRFKSADWLLPLESEK